MRKDQVQYMLSVLVSAGAGALLSVIVRVNATLGAQVGELEATFVVHLVGTGFALLVTLPWLGSSFWATMSRRPWTELSGGAISVAMVFVSNYVVPVLGTALTVSLTVAADLFFSTVSDRSGWMDLVRVRLSPRRLLGLGLVFAGVLLIQWG